MKTQNNTMVFWVPVSADPQCRYQATKSNYCIYAFPPRILEGKVLRLESSLDVRGRENRRNLHMEIQTPTHITHCRRNGSSKGPLPQ